MHAPTATAESAEPLPAAVDLPVASPPDARVWGSDMVAEAIRNIGLEYVALNPGASFRGLHHSLVLKPLEEALRAAVIVFADGRPTIFIQKSPDIVDIASATPV